MRTDNPLCLRSGCSKRADHQTGFCPDCLKKLQKATALLKAKEVD